MIFAECLNGKCEKYDSFLLAFAVVHLMITANFIYLFVTRKSLAPIWSLISPHSQQMNLPLPPRPPSSQS